MVDPPISLYVSFSFSIHITATEHSNYTKKSDLASLVMKLHGFPKQTLKFYIAFYNRTPANTMTDWPPGINSNIK